MRSGARSTSRARFADDGGPRTETARIGEGPRQAVAGSGRLPSHRLTSALGPAIVRIVIDWTLLAISAAVALGLYTAGMAMLVVVGRRADAAAMALFVPDCLVLFRRLLGDARIPRWRKLLVAAVLVYLATPIDLVPDFIPVVGALDDAIIVAIALRALIRGGHASLVRSHWPGPARSVDALMRIA